MPLTDERRLRIAVGDTVKRKKIKNKKTQWSGFCALIADPVITKERYKEYMGMPKERQDEIKDVGHYVPTHYDQGLRRKHNMSERDMITLDIDFAESDYKKIIHKTYSNLSYVLHSTHKHSEESPRLRLIFPLSRPVDNDEYEAVARKIASYIDMDWFDDTTFQFSRVMHWPSISRDSQYIYKANGGAWVDPDAVLEEFDNWRDIESWPVSSRVEGKLRYTSEKAEDPREKKGTVGAFCRVYDIEDAIREFLPEIYVETETPGRYSYAKGTTANGAVVYDDGLFLYSHHGTDPCSMRLVNAFDMVRLHKYGHKDDGKEADEEGNETAPTKLPSFQAMEEFIRDKCAEVKIQLVRNVVGEESDEFDDLEEEEDDYSDEPVKTKERQQKKKQVEDVSSGDDDEFDDLDDEEDDGLGLDDSGIDEKKPKAKEKKKVNWLWAEELLLDKNNKIKVNLRNLTLIFENDPLLQDKVALNDFSGDFVKTGNLLGEKAQDKTNGDLWSDHEDIKIKYYLERRYDMQAGLPMIRESIDLVGHKKSFHPVKDYLKRVKWDGKPRVESLLIDYLGAKDSLYTRAVARKTLAAAIARVFKPGCKFDYVLILEGSQGKRKSSFVDTLARGWFTDDLKTFDKPRETVEVLKGKWIVEIPELQAFSKSEIETIKAFFSRRVERTREAFARRPGDYPRQCIFIGTTNDTKYLKDETGNRRFWPVHTERREIDIDKLEANIDQIWAEALEIYKSGEPLYLDPEVEEIARREQAERLVDNPLAGQIESWLLTKVSVADYMRGNAGITEFEDLDETEDVSENQDITDRVYRPDTCALQIWVEALGGEPNRFNYAASRQIRNAVMQLGYISDGDRKYFPKPYGRQRKLIVDIDRMLKATGSNVEEDDEDLGL